MAWFWSWLFYIDSKFFWNDNEKFRDKYIPEISDKFQVDQNVAHQKANIYILSLWNLYYFTSELI